MAMLQTAVTYTGVAYKTSSTRQTLHCRSTKSCGVLCGSQVGIIVQKSLQCNDQITDQPNEDQDVVAGGRLLQ